MSKEKENRLLISDQLTIAEKCLEKACKRIPELTDDVQMRRKEIVAIIDQIQKIQDMHYDGDALDKLSWSYPVKTVLDFIDVRNLRAPTHALKALSYNLSDFSEEYPNRDIPENILFKNLEFYKYVGPVQIERLKKLLYQFYVTQISTEDGDT